MTKPIRLPAMPSSAPPSARRIQKSNSDRQFSIKRTKSEVGYVYWILEGFGKHKCFVLCDTWDEAIEQAESRLRSSKEESDEFLYADGL